MLFFSYLDSESDSYCKSLMVYCCPVVRIVHLIDNALIVFHTTCKEYLKSKRLPLDCKRFIGSAFCLFLILISVSGIIIHLMSRLRQHINRDKNDNSTNIRDSYIAEKIYSAAFV